MERLIDLRRLGNVIRRQWRGIFLASGVLVLLGFAWGYQHGGYSAEVILAGQPMSEPLAESPVKFGSPAAQSVGPSLAEWMQSETVWRSVKARLSDVDLSRLIECNPVISWLPVQEVAALRVRGQASERVVAQANTCGAAMAEVLTEWQHRGLATARRKLEEQIASLDTELESASRALLQHHQASHGRKVDKDPLQFLEEDHAGLEDRLSDLRLRLEDVDRQIGHLLVEIRKLTPALVSARQALTQALQRYTEEHPRVKELRATLAAVEARITAGSSPSEPDVTAWSSPVAVGLYAEVVQLRSQRISLIRQVEELNKQAWELEQNREHLPARHVEFVQVKSRYQALKDERFLLADRLEQLRLTHAGAGVQVLKPAAVSDVTFAPNPRRGLLYGGLGGLLGLLFAGVMAVGREKFDGRIRGEAELSHATQLPLITSLGDLNAVNADARLLWAMQTLALIRHRIGCSPMETFVCGISSLGSGAGRSILIQALAAAARRMEYRVLTITEPAPPFSMDGSNGIGEAQRLAAGGVPERESPQSTEVTMSNPTATAELTVRQGTGSIDRLETWRQAVQQWHAVERCVVLVELPPVNTPVGFLLAEHMPNLLWVGRNGVDRYAETRDQFAVLGRLQLRWVGAVFNRVRPVARRRRFRARAFLAAMLVGALSMLDLRSQSTNAPPNDLPDPEAPRPGNMAVSGPEQLAEWQTRLTLGPGDVFNVSLFEQPDTAKSGIFIGPDGRINYLEARDVVAAGLTVDELRTKLENILAKYRLSPRVVIIPTAYASKKYYLLGNVNQKGVFLLDRPVTIIEAIARSGGFMTSQGYRNTLTQADLARSFLIRRQPGGAFGREVVDFEALFQRGDLSQNVALAPDDYLFFPPLDLQEVYVLGEVRGPGVLPYSPELTAMGAIVARGGFTERAFKSRVLIVRGSLNRPQTFVVNTSDILAARGPDFPLSNRDLIFVHRRPFVKAEELLESALLTFARSFVTTWAGQHIDPFITEPLVE